MIFYSADFLKKKLTVLKRRVELLFRFYISNWQQHKSMATMDWKGESWHKSNTFYYRQALMFLGT